MTVTKAGAPTTTARGGTVVADTGLVVGCPTTCRAAITATTSKRGKPTVIGKASLSLRAGKHANVTFKLSRAGAALLRRSKKLRVNVPIELVGEPEGVKTQGGLLEQIVREVEIECLPADIPNAIELSVAGLVFGVVLRVSDLPKSDKVRIVTDADQPVAHIISIKEEVAATPDAVAGEAAAAPAEPEVIKKGKQETEEEAGTEKPEKKEKK